MPRHLLIVSVVLCLLLVSPAAAEEQGPKDVYAAVCSEHARDLETLSEWAQKKKLFAQRDRVYARILLFDPDHEMARRRLKYERVDGEWVQAEDYKRPMDFNRSAVDEFKERFAGLIEEFDGRRANAIHSAKTPDDMLWALDLAEAWISEEPNAERPKTVLRATLVRAYQAMWSCGNVEQLARIGQMLSTTHADDPVVRMVLEETQIRGTWVLRETKSALARRSVLRAKAAELLAAVPEPKESPLTNEERGFAMPRLAGIQTKHVRVIGTGPAENREKIARTIEAAGPFLAWTCFHDPKRRPGMRVYVFWKDGEVDQFLERVTSKDDALVKQREEHKLDIFWLDGRTLVADAILAAGQIDLATSLSVLMMLADTYYEGKPLPGWLDEGISRHLTYLLTGTRMTIGVDGRYGSGDRAVPESSHDWIKKAQKIAAKKDALDLRVLLGKGVDAFNAGDSVLAYAFAVYLIEGVGVTTGRFLEAIGDGSDVDTASRRVFDRPLAVVEFRFRRWLDEMVTARAGAGDSGD